MLSFSFVWGGRGGDAGQWWGGKSFFTANKVLDKMFPDKDNNTDSLLHTCIIWGHNQAKQYHKWPVMNNHVKLWGTSPMYVSSLVMSNWVKCRTQSHKLKKNKKKNKDQAAGCTACKGHRSQKVKHPPTRSTDFLTTAPSCRAYAQT